MLAKWSSTALGALLFLVAPAVAAAPPFRVRLDYRAQQAPRDCPSASELRSAIVAQLGHDPFSDDVSVGDYQVRVELRGTGSGTEARIEWLSASGVLEGERRLASESSECSEIASGVVFAVAVQLQLRSASTPPPPPPAPPPAPVQPPKPRAPTRASTKPTHFGLAGVGGFVEHGAQPGIAAGLRGFGAFNAASWALELEARATLPTKWRGSSGAGFSSNELGLGLAPCLRAGPLGICALGNIGLLSVRGEGVDEARSPSAAVVRLGLRLRIGWLELERVTSRAHLDVWVPLTPRQVLLNREQVWATAPIVLGAGLDLAAIFR
jgi:hypothetical protein